MPLAVDFQGGVSSAWSNVIKTMQRYWERATTTAEQRAPELKQQTQQSSSDDGNGAAAYADPATQEFAAERSARLRRDR
jgi:hypothetical protein